MRKLKAILQCDCDIPTKKFKKIKDDFKDEGIIIVPNNFKAIPIEDNKYKILTKDMYIEHRLCGMNLCDVSKSTINTLYEQWEKTRNGYEFVILAGDMFYDVDYFNKYILCGKE